MHVQASDKKTGKVNPHTSPRIFPRFHQWHAVQQMVTDAREHGAGRNYLVEHSAGSGKSNTIAWLAHRLSNLFGDDNQPVFHKVIVITDRVVLDRQLQRTIFQFDHTPGVVKKIEVDSAQLAGGARGRHVQDHHQHAADVPVRARQDRRRGAGQPAVRGDHRRGALLPGRGRGGAAQAGPRRQRGTDGGRRGPGDLHDAGARAAAEPVLLRVHRDAEVTDAEAVRHVRPGQGEPADRRARHARAVPRVLDEAGDRGGLHPRRARQLHHL